MRNSDRQVSEDEALDILDRGEYGVLSTVAANGQPYGVPVNYCVLDSAIYFHCAVEGAKLDNLAQRPAVSFCVVGETEVLPSQFGTKYESCIVTGTATEVFDERKQRGLEGLLGKYSAGFEEQGARYIDRLRDVTRVFAISIDSVTGKARR